MSPIRFQRLAILAALLAASADAPGAAPPPLAIAHRGDSLFTPENTLAAFASAVAKESDQVEFDVRVSSDGKLVVMHDSTVDRTTNGAGAVSSLTLAQLKALDAGAWFGAAFAGERVPTMAESIAAILPDAIPLIERKAGSAAAYVQELRDLGVMHDVVLQAFDWNFLTAVHALAPEIRLGALGDGLLTWERLDRLASAGFDMVAWEKAYVTQSEVAMVHEAGLLLFAWTVDGPAIQTYAARGVDGIISNDPAMVRQLAGAAAADPLYLGDRLVAYWRLDDGLAEPWAAAVADSWGDNTAELTRTDGLSHWLQATAAPFAGAVHVTGTTAFVTIPRTPQLDLGTNELTLSLWVKLQTLPSQLTHSFAGIYDSVEDSYALYLDRSGRELRFKVTDAAGDAARPGIPESSLATDRWLHVAATYAGDAGPVTGQAAIFLQGQAQDVHTGSDGGGAGLAGLVKPGQVGAIGRNGAQAAYPFAGIVTDVAVWNRALAPAEIARIADAGAGGRRLGDLLQEPTPALQPTALRPAAAAGWAELHFRALGGWHGFQLGHAPGPQGPFSVLPGLTPIDLGGGSYRFEFPWPAQPAAVFHIEGIPAQPGGSGGSDGSDGSD